MSDLLCAIHQPNFFPRLSTLAKLFTADIWVILDDVQFTRRDYQHRCLVAGPDTVERWLTDVSETSTKALLRALDWPGLIYRSSDLPARTGRSERLADLTLAVGASTYLCDRRRALPRPAAIHHQRHNSRPLQGAAATAEHHRPERLRNRRAGQASHPAR